MQIFSTFLYYHHTQIKAYSKFNTLIKDSSGATNMIHMDGQPGSGFTNSNYTGINAPPESFDCLKYGRENPIDISEQSIGFQNPT